MSDMCTDNHMNSYSSFSDGQPNSVVNYKPKATDVEFELISMAIGGNPDLVDKIKRNEDGSVPVIFSVGGVDLDFHKVAKMINDRLSAKTRVDNIKINKLVTDEAQSLLTEKYNDLINDIVDIQNRIKDQKERFHYKWEGKTDMTFKVRITLRPRKDDYGRGIRIFYKEIGAANGEQAQDFARQMLEGFLVDGISIETEVIYE